MIKRGEIYFVNLEPVVGDEANKKRPCLILQNDLGNRHSKKTIVAPFLKPNKYPFVVIVEPTSLNNLDRTRGLDISHIRSVSMERIGNKLGVLEDKYRNFDNFYLSKRGESLTRRRFYLVEVKSPETQIY